MPVSVRKEITVNDIQVGDRFEQDGPKVIKVDRKQVWANVFGENDTDTRLRLVSPVVVYRDELTDEEKAQVQQEKARELRRWSLKRLHDKLAEMNEDPSLGLIESIENARAKNYAEQVSTWELDKFLTRQAFFKIAAYITATMKHLAENDNLPRAWVENDDELLVTAFADWYKRTVDRRTYSPRNPLSRSTSMTSNLFEDLDSFAADSITHDGVWYGFDELVKPRVAEITAWENERKSNR
jgi:hypothetical protein